MSRTAKTIRQFKYFVLAFLILEVVLVYVAVYYYDKNEQTYVVQKEEEFKIGLQAVFHRFEAVSDNLRSEFVADTIVTQWIREAYDADPDRQALLRQKAGQHLQHMKEKMNANLIQSFNIYFSDNSSFLRLTGPDLYEYNAGIAPSLVAEANLTRNRKTGFETGPASAGFRYVYPLIIDSLYIGCIETGVDFFGIRQGLKKIFPYEFRFLINKDYLISKTPFARLESFRMSDISEDFLYEKPTQLLFERDTAKPRVRNDRIIEFNKQSRKSIRPQLQKQLTFGESVRLESGDLFALFFKIQSPDEKDLAYVVAYSNDSTIEGFQRYLFIIIFVGTLALLAICILLFFLLKNYQTIRSKNKELEKIRASLEESNLAKDKFFSVIAHDLRNPFHGLVGLSQVLVEDYEVMDKEKVKRFHNLVYQSAKQGYQLVLNLLEWTRTQTGRLNFAPEKMDVSRIVSDNIRLAQNIAASKNIKIINQTDNGLLIEADYNMIHTVFRNLLSNAIKFSNPGGEILVGSVREENHIRIDIRDSGIGMDEKTIENLFKIDISQSSTGTQGETGTGLGLILCREFISQHNGTIAVKSSLGKGSVFSISLPAL